MTKEQIFESGFIKAFIAEYFEDKIHSFYPDKDRLLYILCNNEQEKKEVTKKQIGITKAKISELGFEGLSFAYLLSCKPESLHNYIEPNKRFDFWLNIFSQEFEDHITDFDPITKAIYLFNEVSELSAEVMENESEFWEWYPQSQCPKIADFVVNIPKEADLLSLIEDDIKQYNKNGYWEFDFEEYERFIDVSKPIEILFNLCELLVQLDRLEMFNEFLEIENESLPPQPTNKSPFSVLEWATIFYYADETKLLSESRLLKTRLEQFMSKHQVNTTFDNFKTKYYEAKKRINEKNDYPINKLELIIPFLKENYKQTVTKVENDIIFLEENKPEY